MDFTIKKYRELLRTLQSKQYIFQSYYSYISNPSSNVIILRHDVDDRKLNSLATAELEHSMGIHGTYYFRIIPQSFDVEVIQKIAAMGHEIGYHYEEIDTAYRQLKMKNEKLTIKKNSNKAIEQSNNQTIEQSNNDAMISLAYEMFKENLEKLRKIVPVTTICMHGSPLSPYDNKLIWSKYDYKELGIIGEPYLDIDWNEFGYLTDTGRRWNGGSVAVRDKVKSKMSKVKSELKSTQDVINALDQNRLPDKLMITVHPQRWTDSSLPWVKELVLQNVKNVVKKFLIKIKD